jgi:nucleoside permease NupC
MKRDKFRNLIQASLIRAIKTVAQTAIATIGTFYTMDIDFWTVITASLIAGLLSLLMSLVGLPECEEKIEE